MEDQRDEQRLLDIVSHNSNNDTDSRGDGSKPTNPKKRSSPLRKRTQLKKNKKSTSTSAKKNLSDIRSMINRIDGKAITQDKINTFEIESWVENMETEQEKINNDGNVYGEEPGKNSNDHEGEDGNGREKVYDMQPSSESTGIDEEETDNQQIRNNGTPISLTSEIQVDNVNNPSNQIHNSPFNLTSTMQSEQHRVTPPSNPYNTNSRSSGNGNQLRQGRGRANGVNVSNPSPYERITNIHSFTQMEDDATVQRDNTDPPHMDHFVRCSVRFPKIPGSTADLETEFRKALIKLWTKLDGYVRTYLAPWSEDSLDEPLTKPENLPTKMKELRKYVHQLCLVKNV